MTPLAAECSRKPGLRVMVRVILLLALAAAAIGGPLRAASDQAACRAPAAAASREPNIFTPEQEMDLGDAVAERYEPALQVIADEDLTDRLRQIGDRLVRHLPATSLQIRFSLIDIPDINAFVLPGGRVYVSRKLVGFAETEDELAAVMGHELGHLVARQQTIEMTRQLRDVINVTDVGDRRDIFEKYNRLVDNAARKPGAFRTASREDRDQLEADRIGLFIVAAAGYDPQAHVRLFDRLTEAQGNTGGVVSRLFGTTSPDAKRLAEMMKGVANVPPGCAETRTATDPKAYQAWQQAVVGYSGLGRNEVLHGVLSKKKLAPALGVEVMHVRFSPDGRYLLAQDEGGIVVLSHQPLAVLFRIEAADAMPALFTPDSRDVVFHTPSLRVEQWRVADRSRLIVRDLTRRTWCLDSALAPDGRTLACVDTAYELSLIDVATSSSFFQKKNFFPVNSATMLREMLGFNLFAGRTGLPLKFSPDGRFFASGYEDLNSETALVYDLTTRSVVALKNPARRLLTGSFTFVAPDRIVGVNPHDAAKSGVIALPLGDVVETFALPAGDLDAPTKGSALLIRPFQRYAVGLFDLATKTVTKGNALVAFDQYDTHFVAERGTGDLGLYSMADNQIVSSVTLPAGDLGRVNVAAVSADLAWLAVSVQSRGAVWDLNHMERVAHMRAFDGAFFDETGEFYADLPRAGNEARGIIRLSPALRQVSRSSEIQDRRAAQFGRWLLVTKAIPEGVQNPQGATYELRDVRKPATLWSRSFPSDAPEASVHSASDAVAFVWLADSPSGRELIRKDPVLRSSVKMSDIEGDYLVEIVDAPTGTLRRRLLIETGKGSFGIRALLVSGDWLIVSDTVGRVLVYSVTTGELLGHAFGSDPVVSVTARLLALDVGAGRLVLYDLESMHRKDQFTFTHRVPLKAFSGDGKKLFVLTADQTAYVLDVTNR